MGNFHDDNLLSFDLLRLISGGFPFAPTKEPRRVTLVDSFHGINDYRYNR